MCESISGDFEVKRRRLHSGEAEGAYSILAEVKIRSPYATDRRVGNG